MNNNNLIIEEKGGCICPTCESDDTTESQILSEQDGYTTFKCNECGCSL